MWRGELVRQRPSNCFLGVPSGGQSGHPCTTCLGPGHTTLMKRWCKTIAPTIFPWLFVGLAAMRKVGASCPASFPHSLHSARTFSDDPPPCTRGAFWRPLWAPVPGLGGVNNVRNCCQIWALGRQMCEAVVEPGLWAIAFSDGLKSLCSALSTLRLRLSSSWGHHPLGRLLVWIPFGLAPLCLGSPLGGPWSLAPSLSRFRRFWPL